MKIDFNRLIERGERVLLADGGSTKMEWLELCDRKVIWRHEEPGVNPLTMGMQPLKDTFKRVLTLMPEAPVAVGYYGAGCTPKVCNELEKVIQQCFGCRGECGSDLLLAARLLCPHGEGLVCILGTGSNSGLFADGELKQRIPSLGYLLGDEGGAGYIGKHIVADCLRGIADEAAMRRWHELGLTEQDVLNNVYGESVKPAAWLGKISQLMSDCYAESEYLRNLARKCLNDFFTRLVLHYNLSDNTPIYFAGTPARHFADELRQIGESYGLNIAEIVAKPFDKIF